MRKIGKWMYILPLAAILSGCVLDDLSLCPQNTGLSLSLSYRTGGQAAGKLPIERADLFVFDSRGRFLRTLTDRQGPFTSDRRYELELPPGDYTVAAWGNLQKDLRVSHDPFVPGMTTLEEACILLSGLSVSGKADTGLQRVSGPEKFLYHGRTGTLRVESGKKTGGVIPLYRDTKVIRLQVRYLKPDGSPCDEARPYPYACMLAADGGLKFDNSYLPLPAFVLENSGRNENIPNGFDAVFHKMTLRLDEPQEPEIILTDPRKPDQVIYRAGLTQWLRGTGYDTQEALDNTHEYVVELRFACTHTTVRIFVNGWEYVPIDEDI